MKAIVESGDGLLIWFEENEKGIFLELASSLADHGDHLFVFVAAAC